MIVKRESSLRKRKSMIHSHISQKRSLRQISNPVRCSIVTCSWKVLSNPKFQLSTHLIHLKKKHMYAFWSKQFWLNLSICRCLGRWSKTRIRHRMCSLFWDSKSKRRKFLVIQALKTSNLASLTTALSCTSTLLKICRGKCCKNFWGSIKRTNRTIIRNCSKLWLRTLACSKCRSHFWTLRSMLHRPWSRMFKLWERLNQGLTSYLISRLVSKSTSSSLMTIWSSLNNGKNRSGPKHTPTFLSKIVWGRKRKKKGSKNRNTWRNKWSSRLPKI